MNTVSSDKSLIRWNQNRNRSNISNVEDLFLKDDYLAVFTRLAEYARNPGKKVKFLDAWHKICNDACDMVQAKLLQKSSDKESVDNAVNKFRGNLGEILVEKIFELFGTNWDIKPGSYTTVDPQNEKFIDGQGVHISDGLPIGVQVKNYKVHSKTKFNPVDWKAFVKSMAMNSYWAQDIKIVEPKDLAVFFSKQRQYIFAFTDAENQMIVDENAGSVRFIGPSEIENKLDLSHKEYVFQQIADEIAKVF